MSSASKVVLLRTVQNGVKIVAQVLRPADREQLRGDDSAVRRVGKPDGQRPLGKVQLLVLREMAALHPLNLGGEDVEPLCQPERPADDLINDVASMRNIDRRKRSRETIRPLVQTARHSDILAW
jgi:hypothetical protein